MMFTVERDTHTIKARGEGEIERSYPTIRKRCKEEN